MVHLTRAIDRALGYAFVPTSTSNQDSDMPSITSLPTSTRTLNPKSISLSKLRADNTETLFSTAASVFPNAPKVQDVQERWIDHREVYDAWETENWKKEGRDAAETEAAAKRRSDQGV